MYEGEVLERLVVCVVMEDKVAGDPWCPEKASTIAASLWREASQEADTTTGTWDNVYDSRGMCWVGRHSLTP